MQFETIKEGSNSGQLVRLECCGSSVLERPLWWQEQGLSYTATGYGSKIPTRYLVRTVDQKWRRVYCAQFSNAGTLYVMHGKNRTIVNLG